MKRSAWKKLTLMLTLLATSPLIHSSSLLAASAADAKHSNIRFAIADD